MSETGDRVDSPSRPRDETSDHPFGMIRQPALRATGKYVSKSDMVTDALRELITDRQLSPGTPLRQRDFAEQLDVSYTPVREALRRLEPEGLLVTDVHRGPPLTTGGQRREFSRAPRSNRDRIPERGPALEKADDLPSVAHQQLELVEGIYRFWASQVDHASLAATDRFDFGAVDVRSCALTADLRALGSDLREVNGAHNR